MSDAQTEGSQRLKRIARRLNIEEICTRDRFLVEYDRDDAAKKAEAVLNAHQVFPLTYESPALPYLNVLGLYTYFSGSLIESITDNRSRTFRATICGGREQQRDLSDLIEKKLGLILRYDDTRNARVFAENGAIYARLLWLMGFHLGRRDDEGVQTKARTGHSLPKYLTDVIENFDGLAYQDKHVAKRYVQDLIMVIFNTKASVLRESLLQVDVLAQPTREECEKQAAQIVNAFGIVYPEAGLGKEQVVYTEQRGLHKGSIHITAEQIAKLVSRYGRNEVPPPMRVEIKLTPSRYSFERKAYQEEEKEEIKDE